MLQSIHLKERLQVFYRDTANLLLACANNNVFQRVNLIRLKISQFSEYLHSITETNASLISVHSSSVDGSLRNAQHLTRFDEDAHTRGATRKQQICVQVIVSRL